MSPNKRKTVDLKTAEELKEKECQTFVTADGKTTTLLEFLH